MTDITAFHGPNAAYVLDLYDKFLDDPSSVATEWQTYFQTHSPDIASLNGAAPTSAPVRSGGTSGSEAKIVAAAALAQATREYGHLDARLDPLGTTPPGAPELDPATYGISDDDLERLPPLVVGGSPAEGTTNALEAMNNLREIYCGAVGFELDHIHVPEERDWLVHAIESREFLQPMERAARRALLRRLTYVEAFENFLHQTYLGQKRFSVEGTDMLVPMLDEIVKESAAEGVREIIIGMAHRGRLNVLAHILGKTYSEIVAAFEGARARRASADSETDPAQEFSGDVKYHLGARLLRGEEGDVVKVPMVLAPNPSHLEAVNPVVEGMVRALQDVTKEPGPSGRDHKAGEAILIHGDAAFPGQGVVAETLNLSALPGYTTGGTIHIIVNNQIGFTTFPDESRSTLYSSDLAKGFEVPIIHVNADVPESCLMAARMAIAYRAEFRKDFLIDLVGYRRWGHNEGDEPSFTQPKMYQIIDDHPTVRKIYADQLVAEEAATDHEPDGMYHVAMDHLASIRRSVTDNGVVMPTNRPQRGPREEIDTTVSEEQLRNYDEAVHAVPEDFAMSPKLARQWNRRSRALGQSDPTVDWAHAEELAMASILSDGIPIRLTGQDTERGTFSQRHLVLHNIEDGSTYTPLEHLPTATASFDVFNSPLSEEAAVGFEYGYSVQANDRFVVWEAQFGDFSNGAQVMIDQFIAAARSKWLVYPSLVMLLPHGYEGQGPEHSSARLERFLQLSAQDNLRVANCTTSAQYFHLLRRQALRLTTDPRPLILMTPKSLLRNPRAASPFADLSTGSFKPVLTDPVDPEKDKQVRRLVFCSGKIAIDLDASSQKEDADWLAVARVEQLAPFQNTAITETIERYPNATEYFWLQEEPKNMGGWTYMEPRLRRLLDDLPVHYVGREPQASPAEGSAELHASQQAAIVAGAFADPPPDPKRKSTKAKRSSRSADSSANGATSKSTQVSAKSRS